jgi:predicted metal-binding membrane protein
LSGALLLAAGLYQLTPLKSVCLNHCRTPAAFIAAHWRPGVLGAWRMGLAHGLYCVGCCAALMLLLFVGGIMNLVWIAGLTLFVSLEKLAPFGAAAARATAAVFIAAGISLMVLGR